MVNRSTFIVTKKSFLVFIIFVALAAVGISKVTVSVLTKKAYYPLTGKKIVIDPGHGGVDSGANSNQFLEKEVNLKTALKLREILVLAGAEVIMTREDDSDVTEKGDSSKKRYYRDMDGRKNVMNDSDADVFISLHVNSCRGATRTRGAYVFHHKNSEAGKLLAISLSEQLNAYMESFKKSGELAIHDPRTADYYLLRNAKIPAALVEMGFMTHDEEKKLLLEDDYQEGLAKVIADGLRDYFLVSAGASS